MARYAGRKLAYLVPVLLAVTALTFLLASLLPGDVAVIMLGDQATPANVAALHKQLGLDQPAPVRYLRWLGGVVTGDFGVSPRTREPALHAIAGRLPVSLELIALAEVGALLLGVSLGVLCSARREQPLDRAVSAVAFGSLSIPSYMLAILLIFVFALRLGIFPSTGYVPFFQNPLANLRGMALPAATLMLGEWPVLMRVLRSDMIATLQQEYITAARAKGVTARRVLLVHALKPSSLTLVTVAGFNLGRLIGGAVIVEVIFALPGMGRMLVESILTRDYVLLQGGVVFVAAGFVLVNMVVDLLYMVLDPRVRHDHS